MLKTGYKDSYSDSERVQTCDQQKDPWTHLSQK